MLGGPRVAAIPCTMSWRFIFGATIDQLAPLSAPRGKAQIVRRGSLSQLKPNWSPFAGVVLAILSCYGTIAVVSVLALFGMTVTINGTAWSLAIVAFAALAVIGLTRHYGRHRHVGPLVLGASGLLALTWVMFGTHNKVLELAAFAALFIAAIFDHRISQRLRGR